MSRVVSVKAAELIHNVQCENAHLITYATELPVAVQTPLVAMGQIVDGCYFVASHRFTLYRDRMLWKSSHALLH